MKMKLPKNRGLASKTLAVAALAATVSLTPVGVLACGLIVSENIKLQDDMVGCAGDGIVVTANNVTIDLNGHSILGLRKERTAGVRVYGFNDVTIENGTIAGFERGIYLYNTKTVTVQDVQVNGNRYEGLMAYQSSEVNVLNSSFANNTRAGIWGFDTDAKIIGNLGLDNPNRTFYFSGGEVTLTDNIARGGAYYSAFTIADGYIAGTYSFGDNMAEDIIGAGYLFASGFGGTVIDRGGNGAKNTGNVVCWTEDGVCPLDLNSDVTEPVCGDSVCESEESVYSCPVDCGPPPGESSCDDGIDNDEDGVIDCDDIDDCLGESVCDPAPVCELPDASCSTDEECCSLSCWTRGKKAFTCH